MPTSTDTIWSVYIIENKLNQYYTGICKDLARRFDEHNSGGRLCAKALKGKSPLTLVFAADMKNHSDALKAEMWIKKLSKDQKIKLVNHQVTLDFAHSRHKDKYLNEIMLKVTQ